MQLKNILLSLTQLSDMRMDGQQIKDFFQYPKVLQEKTRSMTQLNCFSDLRNAESNVLEGGISKFLGGAGPRTSLASSAARTYGARLTATRREYTPRPMLFRIDPILSDTIESPEYKPPKKLVILEGIAILTKNYQTWKKISRFNLPQ